ncbi:hypothetical protein WMY93_026280 [Mugilogobius chulae]|uniref:Uncharacterized protein n=1 Tax=Mugilogobius chulae TaxID=88201 RepID=A0AAW0MYK5_9GOBI
MNEVSVRNNTTLDTDLPTIVQVHSAEQTVNGIPQDGQHESQEVMALRRAVWKPQATSEEQVGSKTSLSTKQASEEQTKASPKVEPASVEKADTVDNNKQTSGEQRPQKISPNTQASEEQADDDVAPKRQQASVEQADGVEQATSGEQNVHKGLSNSPQASEEATSDKTSPNAQKTSTEQVNKAVSREQKEISDKQIGSEEQQKQVAKKETQQASEEQTPSKTSPETEQASKEQEDTPDKQKPNVNSEEETDIRKHKRLLQVVWSWIRKSQVKVSLWRMTVQRKMHQKEQTPAQIQALIEMMMMKTIPGTSDL